MMIARQGENTTLKCKFVSVNQSEDLLYTVRWIINGRVVEEEILHNLTGNVELYLNTTHLHSHKFGTKVSANQKSLNTLNITKTSAIS